jgi:hypothetical protein
VRFKFSIRDLLLLTAVLALVVGWWLDHRQLAEINERLIAANQRVVVNYSTHTQIRARTMKLLQASYSEVPGVSIRDDPARVLFVISAPEIVHLSIDAALEMIEELSSDGQQPTTP